MSSALLHAHPTTPSRTVERIEVEVMRERSRFTLRYVLTGSIESLLIPEPRAPQRTDELWRHTCCELFMLDTATSGYLEFNFSPSAGWATYRFTGYRDGMTSPAEAATPAIRCERSARLFVLQAELELAAFVPTNNTLQCALACVVEDIDGAKSYWSLMHASLKPDFHQPEGFKLVV
jgi:hypothetical protein